MVSVAERTVRAWGTIGDIESTPWRLTSGRLNRLRELLGRPIVRSLRSVFDRVPLPSGLDELREAVASDVVAKDLEYPVWPDETTFLFLEDAKVDEVGQLALHHFH